MASGRLSLPKGVEVEMGDIYSDGWCSPEFEIFAAAASESRCLKVSLLNPDFSPIFLDNYLTVSFNDKCNQIAVNNLNQRVDMLLHIDAGEDMRTRVTIGKAIPPRTFDPRERSMKLLLMTWVEVKMEEGELI